VEVERGRNVDRLVTFVDAVVAIAITLLALPLADIAREAASEGDAVDLGKVLDGAFPSFLGFVISFFVIARLWWSHHRVFEHVVRWDGPLVLLSILWLFTVVLLAPVTSLLDLADPLDPDPTTTGVVAIYIGTMTASSLLLNALTLRVWRHPELTDGADADAGRRLFGSVETTVGFLIALVVGTAVPVINYFALFALAITGQVGRLVWNRTHRRR
jgi:uncharacterized membrane protein